MQQNSLLITTKLVWYIIKKKIMILRQFTFHYTDKRIGSKIFNKFCIYPKKTKLYKQGIKMLNNGQITRLDIN